MMPTSVAGDIHLREARIEELPALGELCLRSKAVWGYDAAFLEACRPELSITAGQLETTIVRVAVRNGRPLGVGQIAVHGHDAELVKLFVEPDALGQGFGRVLFDWAVAAARAAGARQMTIDSDPGAASFYVRMGAEPAGVVPSGSIPGRVLPRLALALDVASGSGSEISRNEMVPEESRAMKTYSGVRGFDGLEVKANGVPLPEHYEIKQFTTWGFEWTYEGDSPQQLALAIIYDHTGDGARAIRLSEPFMRRVIANLDNDWTLTSDEVQHAIVEIEAEAR